MRNRDPFETALAALRQRAIDGVFEADRPIVILDEARTLKLSTTPVREALAWLGGAGIIQRGAAGGYTGLRQEPALIAGRYRLRLHCLLQAVELVRLNVGNWDRIAVENFEAAVLDWIAHSSGDVVLIDVHARLQVQIAPLGAAESRLLGPGTAALSGIVEAARDARFDDLVERLKGYHEERIAAAPLLAAELVVRAS